MLHSRTAPTPDRRELLRGAAALAGAGLLAPGALAGPRRAAQGGRKTERVVLVVFAGGVRTRETFGSPENVPNLRAMADEGVLYTRARTANLGHFGATLSVFTGISEARGIRENARGADPTLFEYLRKDLGLVASDVWITTSGGPQQVNYSYGTNAEYGAPYGANTLDGDGIFNREFRQLLAQYGRPKEMGDEEAALLKRMRESIGGGDAGERVNSAESAAVLEKYILDELTRGTSDITGVNAGDAKALRVARNLVSFFKPSLVSVVLQNADVAHGSYNAYAEVVRRNDAAIGEIWDAVKADPELAETTAFFVVPEFGRDRDLNSRRGLDHGDGSDDLNWVSCLAWGPDFRRGREIGEEVRTIDVMPTICRMFGAEPRYAKGKPLPSLLA
jgi:hypothetical protein